MMTDRAPDDARASDGRSGWDRLAYAVEWGWAHLTAWLGALFWLCFWLAVVGGRRLAPLRRRWRMAAERRTQSDS